MSLFVRNLVFTFVVPGTGAVLAPWWILSRHGAGGPKQWAAMVAIAVGALLYFACVRVFAVVGRGTPGPWDAPRKLVVVGPYRWVRNPIYVAALVVVLGEAWLFLAASLLWYALAMAVTVHLFVIGYEEPHLRRRFGNAYEEYLRTVPRWIPRRPRTGTDGGLAADRRP